MSDKPAYRRVLLKVSGEMLGRAGGSRLNRSFGIRAVRLGVGCQSSWRRCITGTLTKG